MRQGPAAQYLAGLHPCLWPLPQARFTLSVLEDGPVDAFCGWFDTQFKGSAENPTTTEVTLTTAPDPTGATHWGQQVGRQGGCGATQSAAPAGPSGSRAGLLGLLHPHPHCTWGLRPPRPANPAAGSDALQMPDPRTSTPPPAPRHRAPRQTQPSPPQPCSRSSCTLPSSARRVMCWPATSRWRGARTTSG